MEYRWTMNTINAKRGEVRQLDPSSPNTAILLANGTIEPVENKATQPPEVKAPVKRKRKAKANE